jgi:SAM-dependent methyltransferase
MLPGQSEAWIARLAADKDERFRIIGLRMCRLTKGDVIALVESLVNDPSVTVRRECAIALKGLAGDEKGEQFALGDIDGGEGGDGVGVAIGVDQRVELDRQVARERKIDLEILQGSMDDLSMLREGRFDLVIHPVSTCYLPDVARVFREVARVTRPGGLYVSQHKSPASLQASIEPAASGCYEFVHPQAGGEPLPPQPPSRLREAGTQEFVHSLSALLGGICAAGFTIEDVCEPDHTQPGVAAGAFAQRAAFIPPYIRILARRITGGAAAAPIVLVE